MSHSVTIRYRYTLFAHKLARVDNIRSGICQMSWQQQKARIETAIDWAQVMTKIFVSCAISRLYMRMCFLLYNKSSYSPLCPLKVKKKKPCRKSLINSE